MRLPLLFAIRYIFTRKSFHFINIITITSIIGIIVGVSALIIVMSIFGGFRVLTEHQIVGFDPHIRLTSSKVNLSSDSLLGLIRNIKGIESSSAVVEGRAALMHKSAIQVVNLKLLSESDKSIYKGVEHSMQLGKFALSDSDDFPKISLGIAIADKLRAFPGDTIYLISPDMLEKTILLYQRQQPIEAVVSGVYQSNIKDYDYTCAFSTINIAERLFKRISPEMHPIEIRVKSLNDIDEVSRKIKSIFSANVNIQTWKDLNKELFRIMEFEKISSFTILSLIVLIAVFNILASLSMTVTEKQSDIAILKSLGAKDKQIYMTFMLEGLLIGLMGTIAGMIAGVLLSAGQSEFGWIKIDSTKYIIDSIPVQLDALDIIFVCCVSLVLSLLATVYPARRASLLIISQSLRSE